MKPAEIQTYRDFAVFCGRLCCAPGSKDMIAQYLQLEDLQVLAEVIAVRLSGWVRVTVISESVVEARGGEFNGPTDGFWP